MNRAELEIAILATEMNCLLERMKRYSTPQLRALLGQVQKRPGNRKVQMSYADMRRIISTVGEAVESYSTEPLTKEPGVAVAQVTARRALRDFEQDIVDGQDLY